MFSLLPLTDLIVCSAKLKSAAVKITPRCLVSWMLWWREMFSQNIWTKYTILLFPTTINLIM